MSGLPRSSHALVTGGGRGIGREIASTLARAGATVTVLGRHRATLDDAIAAGAAHFAAVADVADQSAIRAVNAVCPGFTDTDLLAGSIDNIMKKTGRSHEQAVAELSRHNPQGRLVTPAEVADTVLWLCGEGAGAITGQAIAVAGGEI